MASDFSTDHAQVVPDLGSGQTPAATAGPGLWAGIGLSALFAAAGILPFALVHIDDVDGAVYQVVARHLAQDGGFFHLRFLPDYWPQFFEHPPLYFWVQAMLIRIGGEPVLPWLGAAIGISTVVVTYLLGRRLVGDSAALFGAFILAATEQFFRYQARPRLDPPLALAYTLSVALLLASRGRAVWLVAGGLVAGLGTLVKGPPALGAIASAMIALAIMGRWVELRRPRTWVLPVVAALLPPLAFLAIDRLAFGGVWWEGYVRGQLAASLSGARMEGASNHTYLLQVIARRFWPGLPFLVVAVVVAFRSLRRQESRVVLALCAWAAVIVAGFASAARSFHWYVVPAYMPLALAAGAGLKLGLERLFGQSGLRKGIALLAAAGVLAFGLVPLWPARWLAVPCPFGDLPARVAASAPAGAPIRLAASPQRSFTDVRAHAGWLAQHSGHDVVTTAEARASTGAFEAPLPGVPTGWIPIAQHGVWVLAVTR